MNSMRKIAGFVLFLCLVFPAAAQSSGGRAVLIPIRGDIEPSLAAFVRREAGKAVSEGAEYIIFEIDTFGGRVDSALQIASYIMSLDGVKTVAWVNYGENSVGVSWSAGALIAFSCSEIYMAPGTSIGAAAPVISGLSGSVSADEKSVAAIRSQMAALAERNGHPAGIAVAMVDYDVELWEVLSGGETRALTLAELERIEKAGAPPIGRVGIISPSGKLLSLTAGEAVRYGLAAGLTENREALLTALGITGGIREAVPGIADDIVSFLTSGPVQAILILLGLVMIFLEIQSPGFGIPGICAVVAFILVFGSGALLGKVGSLEIILFLAGLGFLAVEIFVTPGFGVMGISGILLVGLSLLFSMQDFVIPHFEWEWDILGRNALVVIAGLVASIFGIAIIALAGPKLRMFDIITLKTQITGTAGGPDPDSPLGKSIASGNSDIPPEDEENFSALVGSIGVTDSVLRPSGRAVFGEKIYDVVADGEFIEAGRGVAVIRVRGNRIVVKRV